MHATHPAGTLRPLPAKRGRGLDRPTRSRRPLIQGSGCVLALTQDRGRTLDRLHGKKAVRTRRLREKACKQKDWGQCAASVLRGDLRSLPSYSGGFWHSSGTEV